MHDEKEEEEGRQRRFTEYFEVLLHFLINLLYMVANIHKPATRYRYSYTHKKINMIKVCCTSKLLKKDQRTHLHQAN